MFLHLGKQASVYCFFLMYSLSAYAEEQIPLKSFTTKSKIIPGPTSFLYESTEEKDLMPGNDSFGFFYLDKGRNRGVCRLRLNVLCDRGLNFFTPLKNKKINLMIDNKFFSQKSNINGVVDMLFRCPKGWGKSNSKLSYGSYEKHFILKNTSEKFVVPDDRCK